MELMSDVDIDRIKKIASMDGEKVARLIENMNHLIELEKKKIETMKEMMQAILCKTIHPDNDKHRSYSTTIEYIPGKGRRSPRFVIKSHNQDDPKDINGVDFSIDEIPKVMFDNAIERFGCRGFNKFEVSRIKKKFNDGYKEELKSKTEYTSK